MMGGVVVGGGADAPARDEVGRKMDDRVIVGERDG